MLIVLDPPDEEDEDPTTMKLILRKYRDGPSRKTSNALGSDIMEIYESDAIGDGRFPVRKLGKPEPKANPILARLNRNGKR